MGLWKFRDSWYLVEKEMELPTLTGLSNQNTSWTQSMIGLKEGV
jgi:hypothetical protein